ncbi:gamma-glutamyltransferase family protein [Sediminicoccus rosea]|jgi:gamma-glutamyltranspeptidase/glutathione hydrolase|uniref:Gamma-glutamyltransferase family protein n=1 Tax=Sediminicoccus rosea TaxID=1225128 RepID=A0ABZ0PFA7_9PROT|nr:gamma-glutamyltransferase family protein [Sediminicoccus rosea]WPB84087.1 gamma-glutamyltransferase family protein [Sediminicoccus rosea]
MFTTRPEIAGTFGAVATTHWLASQVGMAVLERGGNAFDAAAAAGFTLQIVEPHLNGPGGDCPIILHDAKQGREIVICGQGPAPAGLSVGLIKGQLGLDIMPGTGFLPAPIPGAFDAWATMLQNHGTWRLRDVLAYAISYARNGAHMVARICQTVATVRPLFEAEWTSSAALWLRNGGPQPGQLYANPTLADTYERVLREAEAPGRSREMEIEAARRAWYGGFVAEAVERFARQPAMDTSGQRHAGVITAHDMSQWRAGIEEAVRLDYQGTTVLKCGAWSQGPAMLQTLALLADYDLTAMDPVGPDYVHHVTEAMKLAFADREAFYGDPNFVEVPLATLLSPEYAALRRKLIGHDASVEFRPGNPDGLPVRGVDYAAAVRRSEQMAMAAGTGEPTVSRLGAAGGDTCHIDIIDRDGNFVSATPSAGWLQSSPAIPELGFCLGTRCQMFWLDETLPNGLKPGKRPRTTLSPSLVLREGKPWMSFGTPGGEQQDQWQPIMLTRMLAHGFNIQEAIDLPSFHSEHWVSSFWPRGAKPGKLVLEGRFAPEVLSALRARGHRAEMGGDWSEGRLTGARREADGQIFAGANPRGMQGYAVGR